MKLLGKRDEPELSNRARLRPTAPSQPKPSAFSYRSSRSEPTTVTGRAPNRQALQLLGRTARNFWIQRFGLLVLLIAAVLSSVNVLTLSSNANVMPLRTDTDRTLLRDQAVYQAAATKMLQSSIWNRNKLTVDSEALAAKMKQQFPELANVSVALPLLARRPVFYVQPETASLILSTSTGAYVVGSNGKALTKAVDVASLNQPSLPVVVDQSNLTVSIGRPALSASHVAFIKEVIAQLAAKNTKPATLTLPAATSELYAQIAGQPYTVKFNLQGSGGRQQVGTYLATINQLQKQQITPSKYIDVRVDGRAYYQ